MGLVFKFNCCLFSGISICVVLIGRIFLRKYAICAKNSIILRQGAVGGAFISYIKATISILVNILPVILVCGLLEFARTILVVIANFLDTQQRNTFAKVSTFWLSHMVLYFYNLDCLEGISFMDLTVNHQVMAMCYQLKNF